MGGLPRVTGDAVLRALRRDGWEVSRTRGSHFMLHHPNRTGRPVVPVHAGAIIAPGTLKAILRDAGMTVERFRDLL
jgi:predicted RNA binding protein YcfA (HicA-like mRNA interferase family)